jgi:hypothetical protein
VKQISSRVSALEEMEKGCPKGLPEGSAASVS